jgi:hypothetical protein
MNEYRDVTDRDGVAEHARVEWVGPALCVVLGLAAACLLVEAVVP